MSGRRGGSSGPSSVHQWPVDLGFIVGLAVATSVWVFAPLFNSVLISVVLGVPFILFAPGYALVAALFPEAGGHSDSDENKIVDIGQVSDWTARRIEGFERFVLSVGTSIVVVPLIAFLLNFTPLSVRPVPVLLSVSGLTIVCSIIGAIRRQHLQPEERFVVPYRQWLKSARSVVFGPRDRSDRIATIAVALAVMLTLGSVAYTATVPRGGETITEFYLLTENGDGELVATDYPTELARGQSEQLYVGIENLERERVNYTVVVELQQIQRANDSIRVVNERELHRFSTQLAHNESWQRRHIVTPQLTGEQLRLTYLLYQGQPPADPTVQNAYREVHVWVNVSNSN